MNPDTHALAGAYAVNAVTDEERRSFELHLDVCADCRAEVAELRAAAATLATNVELSPPPALRASVLSAISQTRQLSPLTPDTTSPIAEPTTPTPSPSPTPAPAPATPSATDPSRPTPLATSGDELAARRQRRLAPWLAGVAAAAVLAVGAISWQPWDDSGAQVSATEQVLRSSDAQRLEKPMGAAEIAIVRSASVGRAVFVADAMPAAPSGKVYQLWLDMPGRGMVNAGLIKGSGAVTIPLEGDAKTATGAGITVEPAAGSEKPTTTPVALFSFT